jgi:hypothetical protein
MLSLMLQSLLTVMEVDQSGVTVHRAIPSLLLENDFGCGDNVLVSGRLKVARDGRFKGCQLD